MKSGLPPCSQPLFWCELHSPCKAHKGPREGPGPIILPFLSLFFTTSDHLEPRRTDYTYCNAATVDLSHGLETGDLAHVWAPLSDLRQAARPLLSLSFLICKNTTLSRLEWCSRNSQLRWQTCFAAHTHVSLDTLCKLFIPQLLKSVLSLSPLCRFKKLMSKRGQVTCLRSHGSSDMNSVSRSSNLVLRPVLGTLCCVSIICILDGGWGHPALSVGTRVGLSMNWLVNIANHQMGWLQGCVCLSMFVCVWDGRGM